MLLGEKATYRRSAGGWNMNVNGRQAEHANDMAADARFSVERLYCRWTEQVAEESAAAVGSQVMYPAREEANLLRGEVEEEGSRR